MLYYYMMKSVTRRGHKTGQKGQTPAAIVNRRASFDYALSNKVIVGLQLTGMETKAARLNHVSLKGAYVVPKVNQQTGRSELFLINASFTLNNNAPRGSGQPRTAISTEPRKLLAKRREINQLCEAKKSGMTIVPLRLLTGGKYIKLEIALGKGKKQYDKREAIRRREDQRAAKRLVKSYH